MNICGREEFVFAGKMCKRHLKFLILIFLFGGVIPAVLRTYYWLCTQRSFPVEFGGPFVVLGMEVGLALCKASFLPAVLWLCPLKEALNNSLRGSRSPCPRACWEVKSGDFPLGSMPRILAGRLGLTQGVVVFERRCAASLCAHTCHQPYSAGRCAQS